MYRVAVSSSRRASASGVSEQKACKTLLIVAPADFVSETLVFAIEREFPCLRVECVGELEQACASFECPVPLILLEAQQLPDVALYSDRIHRLHPAAQIMLIQEDGRHQVAIRDVVTARNVRGVLPMNLKLDVWLSVLRLVLRGGEYFPLSLFEPIIAPERSEVAVELGEAPRLRNRPEGEADDFYELTDRELQILGMVARGLQNKLIAAALGLSEHTVKIHLHNIITKLGAHNRTEAAAIYHARRDLGERGPSETSKLHQLPA